MKKNQHNDILLEVIAILLCIGYLIFAMRSTLFFGTTTLTHDNLYWDLPIFHYFAEGIRNGVLPLWNPYSHGGEPLLPAYLQLRMLDPTSFITAWVGQYFTNDLIILFAWDRLIKALIGAIGVYLLLRQWTSLRLVKLSLIPIVFWSSLTLSSLNQNGILDEFYCAPYLALFVFRILYARDYRLRNWVGSGLSFGVCLQSYFFVGSVILITFILFGFAVTRRADLSALIRDRRNFSRATLAAVMILAMSGPLLFMFLTKGDFSFVARGLPQGWESMSPNGGPSGYDLGPQENVPDSLIMPYKMIYYSGTFAYAVDFAGLLVPPFRYLQDYNTDSIQFMGALVLLGALIGVVSGRHPLKRVWGIVGVSFGLLILGAYGGFHWLLYKIYPPLWFIRHTHLLVNFFLMAVLFFYVLGAEFILLQLSGSARVAAPKTKSSWLTRTGYPRVTRTIAQFVVYFFTVWFSAQAVSWWPEVVGDIPPIPFLLTALIIIFWLFYSTLDAQHLVSAAIFGLVTMALMKSGEQINIFIYLLYSLGIPVLLVLFTKKYSGWIADIAKPVSQETTNSAVLPDVRSSIAVTEVISRVLFFILLAVIFVNIIRLYGHYGYFLSGTLFILSLSLLIFVLVDEGYNENIASSSREIICRISLLGILVSLFLPFMVSENLLGRFMPDLHLAGTTVWFELVLIALVLLLRPSLLFTFKEKFQSNREYAGMIFQLIFFLILPWILVTLYLVTFGTPRFTMGVLITGLFCLYIVIAIFWPKHIFMVQNAVLQLPRAVVRMAGGWRKTVPYILLLFVMFDLFFYVEMASGIWKTRRPDTYLFIPKATSEPRLPDTRVVIPQIKENIREATNGLAEPVRYSDLLTRQIAAFDFPHSFPAKIFYPKTFYEVLESARWNSFTAPLSYSRLIHSGLPPIVLQKIFAVGEPLLQYRSQAKQANDFISFINSMPVQQAVDMVAQSVIITGSPAEITADVRHAVSAKSSETKMIQTSYSYNSVGFDVHVPDDGYLYYADGYDRYWRAYVDRKEVSVYRANGNFKAIPILLSAKHVEFVYDPQYLKYFIVLFEVTFLTGVIYLLISYVRGGRHEPTHEC